MLTPASSRYAPHFSGALATAQAQQSPAESGMRMHRMLKREKDPYVGTLPPDVLALGKRNPARTFKDLDRLVARLREASTLREGWQKTLARLMPNALSRKATVGKVGRGAFGQVYRLGVGEHVYALKVFHELKDRNVACMEASNGLYTTAIGTSDFAKFHAGNPQRGWLLMEYIDSAKPPGRRDGQTLFRHGFRMTDSVTLENYINGIRVDMGGRLERLASKNNGRT